MNEIERICDIYKLGVTAGIMVALKNLDNNLEAMTGTDEAFEQMLEEEAKKFLRDIKERVN